MKHISNYLDLPKLPAIYKLFDIQTGKFYIGSSMNLRHRIYNHNYRFNKNIHSNPIMQALWNKDKSRLYIEIQFFFNEISKENLLKYEQLSLDASKVGTNPMCMNVLPIAGSHFGVKRSPETREKLRKINLGRIVSNETKLKQRNAKIGKKQTKEHIKNRTKNAKGKKINRPNGIYNHKTRKLSNEQVIELRRLRENGMSWSILAKHFDMNLSAVRRVALKLTYQDI